MFPLLFVTVACGACSGFHSLVGSGTTSKQLKIESDARLPGYGAVLLEGIFATVALATVWNVFGASNQLLAVLALIGVTMWVLKSNKNRKMI